MPAVETVKETSKKSREVLYVCTQCGAEDRPSFYENEPILAFINCWKCHSGFRVPGEEVMTRNLGMRPKMPGKFVKA